MPPRTKARRCAIYTRKSSEEGLEQGFNSLDAQREACEAFIQSQRHEGWVVIPHIYDDGGFSGGTMERPALQQLLSDIEQREVDIVVVYKVDRLTRALADFAKIVDVFDAQGVSFVSVTQQFNTTTSMGRLTLNILLSFAQFEREVTGERIRDKFLASRKKGLWMGGHPPLGYDIADRCLIVNETEAALVCRIFTRYAETGCVKGLRDELTADGVVSKRRISNAGIPFGGKPLTCGALYKILANRTYLGEAIHKDKTYPGEHKAIIDQDLWDRVQERLGQSRVRRRNGTHAKEPSLLAGLLHDELGRRLTPSHATKRKRRYRYYITPSEGLDEASPEHQTWRIPAHEIEDLVKREILSLLESRTRLDDILDLGSVSPEERLQIYQASAARARSLQVVNTPVFRGFLLSVLDRITTRSDAIELEVHPSRLKAIIHQNDVNHTDHSNAVLREVNEPTHRLCIKTRLKRCRGENRFVLLGEDEQETLPKPDPGLIRAVAKAHSWAGQLISGERASITEIAKRNGTSRSRAGSILTLAFLAPDIVEAILDGRQPPEVNLELLTADMANTEAVYVRIMCINV
jgi:DNA invertase Pin-like site-specific DNA recombinase